MKRLIALLATAVLAIVMLGTATAQGRHGGRPAGRPVGGRPATTGLEHAEATASPHGQRGIENAEAKQAAHKDQDKDKDKDNDKGKANGKHKKHKHSH